MDARARLRGIERAHYAAEVVNAKRLSGKVRELVIARPYQTVSTR